MLKPERFKHFIEYFSKNHPEVETELIYENPFQLLIAVILSAQCTDKRVNMTTPALFEKYPNPEAMAEAEVEEIFQYIKSISYPNNKSKHLQGTARMLRDQYDSQVPGDVTELQKLPGVGRKTAHVILSCLFNQPTLAVDTHVFRVSRRIGLTTNAKTPLQTEKQLVKYLPEEIIATAHHWLILHGRYVCLARNPKCDKCGISWFCKFYEKNQKEKLKKVT
ncbi:MAG: endonuclease III [Chitinophagaceae bacterium]|nr:MAG: endonuclease III [Chitinophagaceae bacterium]